MDASELGENWQRACRNDALLQRFDAPASSEQLVAAVLSRVKGEGRPSLTVLKGLAVGFAVSTWDSFPEAAYLQLATLVQEAARAPDADLTEALGVLAALGDASVTMLLEVWRGEAEQDSLTQLGNRRRMETTARALTDAGVAFEYASIDVDGLKAVNDGPGGHSAGDALLRKVAKHLQTQILESQLDCFRYGGDEFGIICRVGENGALILDKAIESSMAKLEDGIWFSWGSASWPQHDDNFNTVLTAADEIMYERKRARKETLHGHIK
ncbi:GGDEF domain-containing protein [Rathayibacter sp. VKM Ac-2801]|uniref:GGDEF domain-containing protein n=1 Tax=Rathayibacter sp. VKM Ac-2801 TaxID=2609255 RepID=UPI00132006CB|nr:GGDEF domain-containing protein [Rathayibacter sp. VKM Ac-2801]QHC70496.1 diguanylate cyclase [Rathayibacter sp. VKM Ac-2801]